MKDPMEFKPAPWGRYVYVPSVKTLRAVPDPQYPKPASLMGSAIGSNEGKAHVCRAKTLQEVVYAS